MASDLERNELALEEWMISASAINLEKLAESLLLGEEFWRDKTKMTLLKTIRKCIDVDDEGEKMELLKNMLRTTMKISIAEKQNLAEQTSTEELADMNTGVTDRFIGVQQLGAGVEMEAPRKRYEEFIPNYGAANPKTSEENLGRNKPSKRLSLN